MRKIIYKKVRMFGYLRFILAFFVLVSHLDISFYGKNMGVFSVIIFYMLAGMVTSKIFIKVSPSNIVYFIKDRFLRIYPTFFIISMITILFFYTTNFNNFNFEISKAILNLLIIPLNYFFFIDLSLIDNPIGINFVLPPAWSLGAELQAYALLVVAILYKRFGEALAVISFFVFVIANFGIINADIYGYRLICGVFFIFYSGYLLYIKKYKYIAVFTTIILFLLCYFTYKQTYQIFSVEIFCGYVFGVVLIITHEKYKPKIKFNEFFGSLSYIIFLNHYPTIWFCEYYFNIKSLSLVFGVSFVWSVIIYLLVEKNITKYRLSKKSI